IFGDEIRGRAKTADSKSGELQLPFAHDNIHIRLLVKVSPMTWIMPKKDNDDKRYGGPGALPLDLFRRLFIRKETAGLAIVLFPVARVHTVNLDTLIGQTINYFAVAHINSDMADGNVASGHF